MHWICLLQRIDTQAALGCTLQLACDRYVKRGDRADAFLAVASSHYRKGRTAKALVFAGRALLLKPALAKHLAKKGFSRLATSAKM
jgi:hypothetical protein